MITRLEAHGYRCFPSLVVDLDRYHVLAGANGAGKTTLLDIPVLIGEMLRQQRIVGAFLERGEKDRAPRATTLTDLLHKGQGDSIAFAFEARLPPEVTEALGEASTARLGRPVPTHLRYELRLEVTPRDMRVADEYFFLFDSSGTRPVPGSFPQGRSVSGTSKLFMQVAGVFGNVGARRHGRAYLLGLLSRTERKNSWSLAEFAGDVSPDGLQRLLNFSPWDEDACRDAVRRYVVAHLGSPAAVLAVDETGFLKKGKMSAGVARQYTGAAGRVENCQVGVFAVVVLASSIRIGNRSSTVRASR